MGIATKFSAWLKGRKDEKATETGPSPAGVELADTLEKYVRAQMSEGVPEKVARLQASKLLVEPMAQAVREAFTNPFADDDTIKKLGHLLAQALVNSGMTEQAARDQTLKTVRLGAADRRVHLDLTRAGAELDQIVKDARRRVADGQLFQNLTAAKNEEVSPIGTALATYVRAQISEGVPEKAARQRSIKVLADHIALSLRKEAASPSAAVDWIKELSQLLRLFLVDSGMTEQVAQDRVLQFARLGEADRQIVQSLTAAKNKGLSPADKEVADLLETYVRAQMSAGAYENAAREQAKIVLAAHMA
ncbi:MAG: hypothetical protein ABSD88_19055 [Candidatus Korobacteraceae bacterium]|jgi:DNA-binding MarR family transcriptional regulator